MHKHKSTIDLSIRTENKIIPWHIVGSSWIQSDTTRAINEE